MGFWTHRCLLQQHAVWDSILIKQNHHLIPSIKNTLTIWPEAIASRRTRSRPMPRLHLWMVPPLLCLWQTLHGWGHFFKTNSFTDCCIWNVATRHCPFIPEVCILLSLHSKFFEPQHITEFVWPRRCYHFFWDTQEHVIEVKRVKTLNAQCSHVLISSNLLSVGLGHDGYQGLGFLSQTVSYLRTPSHNDFHIPLH